jgi:hypothetical protein
MLWLGSVVGIGCQYAAHVATLFVVVIVVVGSLLQVVVINYDVIGNTLSGTTCTHDLPFWDQIVS